MAALQYVTSESNRLKATLGDSEASGGGRSRRVPFAMPVSEAYYWSFRWQRDEGETLADSDAVVFDSDDPEDAAKWLRTSED